MPRSVLGGSTLRVLEGRRLYSLSLEDVAWLVDTQLIFLIFHTFVSNFFPVIDFCASCWHSVEHFSDAKGLSIIRAF